MKLLAIETATTMLSVACGDGQQWQGRDELAGNAHSTRLLPVVDQVLADAGWRLTDLDGIAFGAGPGSFTGVRIACGVAQGLALGADLPLLPVSTLEALAEGAWVARGVTAVCACLDARMREVYIARYERSGESWREVNAPAVLAPANVPTMDASGFGAGDGFAVYPDLVAQLNLDAADGTLYPTARAVGTLAAPRLRAGQGVDAAAALPLYVRHRVALTTAERNAGLGR